MSPQARNRNLTSGQSKYLFFEVGQKTSSHHEAGHDAAEGDASRARNAQIMALLSYAMDEWLIISFNGISD